MSVNKRARPEPIAILRGHTSPVTALSILPDPEQPARYLLSGDERGTFRLWDTHLEESVLIQHAPSHVSNSPIQSFAQDPALDGHSTLVQYKNGFVRRIDLEYNAMELDAEAWQIARASECNGIGFTSSTDGILCDSFCGIVYLGPGVWAGPVGEGEETGILRDVRTDSSIEARFKITQGEGRRCGMLMSMCTSRQVEKSMCMEILAGYEDGSVAVWDIRRVDQPLSQVCVGNEAVISVAAHPRGRIGMAGGGFGEIVAVGDTAGTMGVLERGDIKAQGLNRIVWSADGRVVASGGWNGNIGVWDGRRRKDRLLRRIGWLKWHAGSVLSMGFGGDMLATGGKDRTIGLWRGLY